MAIIRRSPGYESEKKISNEALKNESNNGTSQKGTTKHDLELREYLRRVGLYI